MSVFLKVYNFSLDLLAPELFSSETNVGAKSDLLRMEVVLPFLLSGSDLLCYKILVFLRGSNKDFA